MKEDFGIIMTSGANKTLAKKRDVQRARRGGHVQHLHHRSWRPYWGFPKKRAFSCQDAGRRVGLLQTWTPSQCRRAAVYLWIIHESNQIKAHNKPKQFVYTSSRLTEISCTDALSRSGRFRKSKFPGADSDDNQILKCAVLAYTALCEDMNHGWDSLLVPSAALNQMTLLTTDTRMFGSPKSMFRAHHTYFHVTLNATPSLMLKTRVANPTQENKIKRHIEKLLRHRRLGASRYHPRETFSFSKNSPYVPRCATLGSCIRKACPNIDDSSGQSFTVTNARTSWISFLI